MAARKKQELLRESVEVKSLPGPPHFIAGADVHFGRRSNLAHCAICVVEAKTLELAASVLASVPVEVPYVPGLLSFRELDPVLAAFASLPEPPDVLLLDGHGLTHPRRFGLACHAGVELQLPTVGCAKSALVGRADDLGEEVGAIADVYVGGSIMGALLRSRRRANPLHVSVGHRITLDEAVSVVTTCLDGYRIPKPLRLAHQRARAAARVD